MLPILLQNLRNNPWYQQYMTIFEQSKDMKSMCVLFSDVIENIIMKYNNSNDEFESMHVNNETQNLSLLFNLSTSSKFPINIFLYHGKHEKMILK
jgi:hypothetical protein